MKFKKGDLVRYVESTSTYSRYWGKFAKVLGDSNNSWIGRTMIRAQYCDGRGWFEERKPTECLELGPRPRNNKEC